MLRTTMTVKLKIRKRVITKVLILTVITTSAMFNFYVIININNISNGINKDVKTIDPNNYTKVNNIPS